MRYIARNPEDMRAFAAAIAAQLVAGDVVVLSGDLGAGKTCFVQGAAAARGVTAHVTSPTFVLVREYTGDVRIVHVDVYRLGALQELEDLGYEDIVSDEVLTFIEWGDAVEDALPDARITVALTVQDDDARAIEVRAFGAGPRARLEAAAAALARWERAS